MISGTHPKALALAALLLAAAPTLASDHPKPGDPIENAELPALDGGRAPLLSAKALANVLLFFRPGQEHSIATLHKLAAWQAEFAAKPVRFVGIVSATRSADEVRAAVKEAGLRIPVLLDADDALYGKLGAHMHPLVVVTDGAFRLVGWEPFRQVNFDSRVRARIRLALKEIDGAAVDRVDDPPPSPLPNEVDGAVAHRNVRLGEMLLDRKQYAKAEERARHVIAIDPKHVPAHVLLGNVLAAQGKCADAGKAYGEALRLDPKNAAAREGSERCKEGR
ncbi:MAG: tetratricopeptide repeat protein [Anaeromyxobacteraceae bacterium]